MAVVVALRVTVVLEIVDVVVADVIAAVDVADVVVVVVARDVDAIAAVAAAELDVDGERRDFVDMKRSYCC